MGDSLLLSFNFQCRSNDDRLGIASQHESPTYNCSSDSEYGYKLDGDCPYIGRRLLQKVRPANENDDYCHVEIMRTTIFVIVKVRLGRDEEHREWDAREKLRSRLEEAAEEVLGNESARDQRKFIYTLLCDDVVIDALRGEEKEELAALIMQASVDMGTSTSASSSSSASSDEEEQVLAKSCWYHFIITPLCFFESFLT